MNYLSMMSCHVLMLLAFASAVAQAPNEEPKAITIPLDKIWANKLPGARDIRALEPKLDPKKWESLSLEERNKVRREALWDPIVEALMESPSRPREGQTARPGFAVLGTGLEALRRAHAVLVDGEKPRESFSLGSEVTLVFFSYPIGSHVHLQQAERQGKEIDIRYRFVGYMEKNLSMQLALIPLGELAVGTYHVKIVQIPTVQKVRNEYKPVEPPLQVESGRRFVCQSFSFEVVEGKSK